MGFISRIIRLGAGLARQRMNSETAEEEDTIEEELDQVSGSPRAQSYHKAPPPSEEPPTITESASQASRDRKTSPRMKRSL